MSINDPKILFETTVTEVRTATEGDAEQVGTIRHGHDGAIYRWVKNTHTAALTIGDVVSHDGATDAANMYKYVENGFTNGLMFMAGVAISAIPINGFGWIQVAGINPTILHLGRVATATAVGDSMIADDGTFNCEFGTAVGAAPLYTKSIIILETVATATTPVAATVAGIIQCFV